MSKLKKCIQLTLPVCLGYVPLGIAFGMLLSDAGYGLFWSFLMATTIFAGSMQFVMVALLSANVSLVSVTLLTFLVQSRHLFYGLSLIERYRHFSLWKRLYMIFSLTDETYSLVTQNEPPEGMSRHMYCFLVSAFNHTYWVAGCVLGSLAGAHIPISFEGVEFVLTALFVTMFVEQWLTHKNHLPAIIGVAATAVCLAIFGSEIFLIPSMVLIAVLLTVSRKTGRRKHDA